ncbi:hydrolase [Thermogemmatispora aurantia]|jgi:pimeloyl-ACP methyl ester carboxylesterase|uniref:Hydrolase n=1 Tax=Thermogemmatispora aurantia TaxID=2045279 RepID=A0A5J4KE54_9CHLR|nr:MULTISPECIES: alpha/beta hydrolase [Thermogemmatispora]GER85605.1 hydrolase [Thermogemmatispora aurantia]
MPPAMTGEERSSWEHRFITANGIRLHYVTQGEGPLVLLLHGFPEFWYSWRHQIPVLAEAGYCVVAPDLRGYNESEKPRWGYDLRTLARDVAALMVALGYERAIVMGHDWGGVIAWQVAMRYPELVERLVIMNAPHPAAMLRELRSLKQLRMSWYIFAFQLPWLPEYMLGRNGANEIGRMLRGSAVQKDAFPRSVTAYYQAAMSKPGALPAALAYYRQFVRDLPRSLWRRQLRAWPRIQAPTLLLWGLQDIALSVELTYGLEPYVKQLRVVYLPESGHWVQQEQPEQVNRLLLNFLQEREANAPGA